MIVIAQLCLKGPLPNQILVKITEYVAHNLQTVGHLNITISLIIISLLLLLISRSSSHHKKLLLGRTNPQLWRQ